MKAIYVFLFCSGLLLLVGCSDDISANTEDVSSVIVMPVKTESPFNKLGWPVTLDSFSSSFINKRPGRFVTRKSPKNKFSISKDKDSITCSGTLYFAYEDKQHKTAYHTYHFYLKTGLRSLDAYLKTDRYINDEESAHTTQKVVTTEHGYHLDWTKKVQG